MRELFPILDIFNSPAQEIVLWTIVLLLPILPNLWCIWHAYRHEFDSPVEKFGWMGAGVFIPVLGGLAYLLIGRRRTRGTVSWASPQKGRNGL